MKTKRSIECWLFHRPRQQFLLLRCPMTRRHPEYWQPITGGVLAHERSIDACLREVREETGVVLQPENIVTVLEDFRVVVPEYHLIVRKPIFTAETAIDAITISDEHLAYCWIAPEIVTSLLFWESNKVSFQAVQKFYRQNFS
ncbi:NUDIX hydrolase [Candidatus Vecturithrix granuli]|uniref:NUDIX hydrolase n=1 Tax=Vecturithrix granuli TaxID=1499967 RepID=A0A081C2V2_VECG1|nr:NUDIX hydrolase [Candidatus Vecturithrix granuli]